MSMKKYGRSKLRDYSNGRFLWPPKHNEFLQSSFLSLLREVGLKSEFLTNIHFKMRFLKSALFAISCLVRKVLMFEFIS